MSAPSAITHLLYLHGFRSSPQSTKARQMARCIADLPVPVHWWCPALPVSPAAAMQTLRKGVRDWPHERMAVMGSSLGGFYARLLSRELGCRAVLINPAVHPARDLAAHIGVHPAWHDPQQRIHFEPSHVQQLQALENLQPPHTPPTLALIAKGDEVLDWREMQQACAGTDMLLLEGGDHALSDFATHLPRVLAFLGLG